MRGADVFNRKAKLGLNARVADSDLAPGLGPLAAGAELRAAAAELQAAAAELPEAEAHPRQANRELWDRRVQRRSCGPAAPENAAAAA